MAGHHGAGMPAGGASSQEAGTSAAAGTLDCAGYAAGISGSARQAIGVLPQGRMPAAALDRATRSAAAPALRGMYVRPELDADRVGSYMRDAIERGGYRAALDYYGSEEAKESDTPQHRLRATGWLLGRLGLYDRLEGWLEEASRRPGFDRLLDPGISGPRAPYRPPPLWLQTPRPAPRSAGRILTLGPAAPAAPAAGAVPCGIWAIMLILDATGPICSRAGLGAAVHLAAAGLDPQLRGDGRYDPLRGDGRYDPLRGAGLHGAPDGCHRWIIADMGFDPRPVHRPHYYYDLTDEGRRALDAARGDGAPSWPAGVDAAASALEGMTLSDLLEAACRPHGPAQDLDGMRDDLGRIVDAWRDQENGRTVSQVAAGDQPLVDLGAAVKWPCDDCGPGSAVDHLFFLMTVVESAHSVACEAEPPSRAGRAVLQTLIGATWDMCRAHARAVAAAAASAAGSSSASSSGGPAQADDIARRPAYEDAMPPLISDLYYCLAEYCRSRGLAVDPCSLPLSERLSEDSKAAVAEALTRDSPFYGDMDRSPCGN